ncbi:MAG: DUF4396 domain-containing protein [Nitrospiraceae bacterium]|nr:DUF4396 domain-containing protein [Nitrospiraceae bacterium]
MMELEMGPTSPSTATGREACCGEEPAGHKAVGHAVGHAHHQHRPATASGKQHGTHQEIFLNRTALMATLHCLSGCTIGEVLGMAVGTVLGWSNWPTVGLAVALAFLFGYGMTLYPLRRAGMAWSTALALAFASDTLSMSTMEFVDNALMLVIPGAMDVGLSDPLLWATLVLSLVLAGPAAFPVNRWLIARGKGDALVHEHHCH